jgi:hypothetical protein
MKTQLSNFFKLVPIFVRTLIVEFNDIEVLDQVSKVPNYDYF